MATYDFHCAACMATVEMSMPIADRDEPQVCGCGTKMKRMISKANVNPDIYARDGGYMDTNLVSNGSSSEGTWVSGKRQRAEAIKRLGLVETG